MTTPNPDALSEARAREVLALQYDSSLPHRAAHIRSGSSDQKAVDALLVFAKEATPPASEATVPAGSVLVPLNMIQSLALFADEWDRWQAKGSTSTERMLKFSYGKARIDLPFFRSARDILSAAPKVASEAAPAQDVEALKEALSWYADPISYAITQAREPRSAVHGDEGRLARKTLAALATAPARKHEAGEVEHG